jgi:hypothetical protein
MKQEDKYCGNCCWFCFETTDGTGQCVDCGKEGYPMMMSYCGSKACKNFISRQQMRHYMAVLVKRFRYLENMVDNNPPYIVDDIETEKFAYKYMKVFGNL